MFVQWYFGEHSYYGDTSLGADNAGYFADNAVRLFEIAEKFRSLGKGEMYFDLAVSAEATAYVNLAFVRQLDGRTLDCKDSFIRWCESYEKSWRRDNKTSDLYLITDLLRKALFD